MDKDFSPAPLDDQDLEALFAAAQRDIFNEFAAKVADVRDVANVMMMMRLMDF